MLPAAATALSNPHAIPLRGEGVLQQTARSQQITVRAMATPPVSECDATPCPALPSGYARYSQGGTDQICCRATEICADHETRPVAIVRRLGTVASFGAL